MKIQDIRKTMKGSREAIVKFMREICAIPGMDGQLNEVAGLIGAEMRSLGFAEARFDRVLRVVSGATV